MKLLVFHNPNAGHGNVPKDVLVANLQRAGHEVDWIEKGGARKLSDALAQPLDAVLVVGGDGSVGSVGRHLAGRGVPIAILPAGTANNIASSLGASSDNLLELLDKGSTRMFDVGRLEGIGEPRLFLEGVGVGAFAESAALLSEHGDDLSPSSRADELSRDLHVLAERVRRVDACTCEMLLDGEEVTGEFVMVEVTIGGTIGPNLRLAVGGVPSDGLLDVAFVDVAERQDLLAFLSARGRGEAPPPPFTVRRVREALLRTSAARTLHVDGEALEPDEPADLRVTIQPAALQFFSKAP